MQMFRNKKKNFFWSLILYKKIGKIFLNSICKINIFKTQNEFFVNFDKPHSIRNVLRTYVFV